VSGRDPRLVEALLPLVRFIADELVPAMERFDAAIVRTAEVMATDAETYANGASS
jgi:hypothetical protein